MRVISLLGRSGRRREFHGRVLLLGRPARLIDLWTRLLLLYWLLLLRMLLDLRLRRLLLHLFFWWPKLRLLLHHRSLLLERWLLRTLLDLRLRRLLLGRLGWPNLRLHRLLLLLRPLLNLLLWLLSRRDRGPERPPRLRSDIAIKRRSRGRRRLLSDNLPPHDRFWRFNCRDGAAAHDALLYRRHRKIALNFRRLNLLRVNANSGSRNGTGVHERVMRNRGHRSDIILVHVGDFIDVHIVVDVSDIDDVHRCVRDIHVLHIAHARAVRRNVHFARTQREPRDASASTTERH